MFHMTMTTPYKGDVTVLKLTRKPTGLGLYQDDKDKTWDISGIQYIDGECFVQARRIDHHSEYYSTATYSNQGGSHKWIPYKVEVMTR